MSAKPKPARPAAIPLDEQDAQADMVSQEGLDDAAGAEEPAAEEFPANEDGTVTLTLKYPITVRVKPPGGKEQEQEISEITFRRPTAEDALVIMNFTKEAEQLKAIFTRLTAKNWDMLGKLDLEDLARGNEIVTRFLAPFQKIGKTS